MNIFKDSVYNRNSRYLQIWPRSVLSVAAAHHRRPWSKQIWLSSCLLRILSFGFAQSTAPSMVRTTNCETKEENFTNSCLKAGSCEPFSVIRRLPTNRRQPNFLLTGFYFNKSAHFKRRKKLQKGQRTTCNFTLPLFLFFVRYHFWYSMTKI